jgi:tRNA U34 5-carboxymethylaminomethyl modifying GTPase MnmE/TrmE
VDSQENLNRIEELKRKIRSARVPVVEYSPKFQGLDANSNPILTDMNAFTENFLTNFRKVLSEFPKAEKLTNHFQVEKKIQLEFTEARERTFTGRKEIMTTLESLTEKAMDSPSKPIALIGVPGAGKSSLLAHFASGEKKRKH